MVPNELRRAVAHYQRGELDAAERVCRAVLEGGPNGPASQLLAMVAMDRGDLARAHSAMCAALAASPEDPSTLVCAGSLALREGRPADGVALFRRARERSPRSALALSWLGTALQRSGDLDGAHEAFAACTRSNPGFAPGWCNLGGVCAALGRLDEAERAYRHAIATDATWLAGHQGLVWVLTTRGDESRRRDAVLAWADACPDHPVPAHLRAAIVDAPAPPRCPERFVTAYFDDFARDYDRTLAELDPTVADTLAALWRDERLTARSALDLGCGTGAASGWLADACDRLVGVDLSPGMLALAARAGRHGELHCADALAYLGGGGERFDAIVLADVLPYFGELAPLFAALASRLAPAGHVLLSFESAPGPAPWLAPTGRYQHTDSALYEAAAGARLELATMRRGVLRTEGGKPVLGACAVLRAATRSRGG